MTSGMGVHPFRNMLQENYMLQYHQKLKYIMDDLLKKDVLGKVAAHVHVIEFQKRGLPHAHILLILDQNYKLRSAEQYDKVVSAEIPDPETQPLLYESVSKHMIHGPCGHLNDRYFSNSTVDKEDVFPVYKRCDNGRVVEKKVRGRSINVDNRYVVPYNPCLIQKYNCHINVEICSSICSVKYLYKYVYKGHDRALAEVHAENDDNDEIKQYLGARYVSSCEACWRIFEFDLHGKSHSIIRLPVHLPNMHVASKRRAEKSLRRNHGRCRESKCR
jgi:hypothetical protein